MTSVLANFEMNVIYSLFEVVLVSLNRLTCGGYETYRSLAILLLLLKTEPLSPFKSLFFVAFKASVKEDEATKAAQIAKYNILKERRQKLEDELNKKLELLYETCLKEAVCCGAVVNVAVFVHFELRIALSVIGLYI
jgi:Cytohesin Ubiquitin Protein Inducing Domain